MDITPQHIKAMVKESIESTIAEMRKSRNPEFQDINFASQPIYTVDYKERKHVYAYTSVASLTLASTDGYTIALTQNGWTNLGVPQGTRLTPSTGTPRLMIKCTDEVIA